MATVQKVFLAIALTAWTIASAGAQPPDPRVQAQLKQLFPSADTFPGSGGPPRHFKIYSGPAEPKNLVGLAFWTTDLEPLERGYDGPIRILVGMNTSGILTGVVVVNHREPYGHFSIDTPAFAAQFKGKNIRDPFRVGADVDAVSTATITVSSAARAIRNSARRVARQLLTPEGSAR